MKINPLKNIKEEISTSAIELYGNKRIIILDCKCILDYSMDCIVLDIGDMNLRIKGKKLVAESFAYGQTDIKGLIESVEFI